MGDILRTLWKSLLFHPFLNLLLLLYALLGNNLGLAVIVLAVLIRIILLPSTRKQMDMTRKMADLRPRINELQKKYKHNQEILAKEQMKLYREVGYNPVGCLGSFLPQILILAAIIGVIRTLTDGNFDGVYPVVKDFVFGDGEMRLNTHFLLWDLGNSYTNIAQSEGYFAFKAIPYLLLGIAVGIVQYFASKFTQAAQSSSTKVVKTNKDEPMSQEEMQAQMAKSMTTIFPFMTAFFTISAPAVLGLYWFVQSLMMVGQYKFMNQDKSKSNPEIMIENIDSERVNRNNSSKIEKKSKPKKKSKKKRSKR